MSFDERMGAPTYEALASLNVAVTEVARVAQMFATPTSGYQGGRDRPRQTRLSVPWRPARAEPWLYLALEAR